MKVHIKTKGRVKIDFMNNLIIRRVQEYDDRYYGSVIYYLDEYSFKIFSLRNSCYDFGLDRLVSLTKLVVTVIEAEKFYIISTIFLQNFIAFFIFLIIISFGYSLWRNRDLRTKR